MKIKEFFEAFNALEDYDKECVYNAADAIDGIGEGNCVAENIDRDVHRWYTIGTNVYKLEDGYVGLRGQTELKSEESSWGDVDIPVTACEYIEQPSVTYVPKR